MSNNFLSESNLPYVINPQLNVGAIKMKNERRKQANKRTNKPESETGSQET